MNAHSSSTAKSDFRHGSATDPIPKFRELTAPYKLNPAAMVPTAPVDAVVHINQDGNPSIKPQDKGKVLGRFLKASNGQPDRWCGFTRGKGQASILVTGATPEEQEEFQNWRTPNFSLLGGWYPGIDADSNTKEAARLVGNVLAAVFGSELIPMRTRSNSPRVLYILKAVVPGAVNSWTIEYRLSGDGPGVTHKLECKAARTQWVLTGSNLKGEYGFARGADLREIGDARLIMVTNENMADLRDAFKRELDRVGGEIISDTSSAGSGGGLGELRDYSDRDPIAPVEVLIEGLRHLPANTEEKYPDRDDLVLVLAAIRAGAGRHAEELEDEARAWAVDSSDGWCDDEYFEKIWNSHRDGVKVDQWALERHLRKAGFHEVSRYDFEDDPALAKSIAAANDNYDATVAGRKARLKRRAAVEYAYGLGNTRSSRAEEKKHRVRHVGSTESEEYLADWWAGKSPNSRTRKFVAELHSIKDWDKDPTAFLTEMVEDHPECIYFGEILDPRYDIGHMVEEKDKHGNTRRRINMRAIPMVQKLGEALKPHSCDDHPDVLNFEKFLRKLFREHAKYEHDTIAWMAQSKRRPGNMLILQGDSGTGKTTYADTLSLMFDGPFSTHRISGVTLARTNGLTYALAALVGGRIGQFVEMVDNPSQGVRGNLDSLIKQLVDAGSGGDTFEVESKYVQAGRAKNYVRLVATTNFRDVLNVGAQDRRLFVVQNGITLENRDDDGDWFNKVLLPILTDEKRLARVWRALLDRDVRYYDPTKPPPQTLGKFELSAIGEPNVYTRIIGLVVPETLKRAGRKFTDADEVWSLARAAVHNIYVNTNHDTDHRHLFDERPAVGATRSAFAKFGLEFPAIKDDLRGNGLDSKKPLPTVYVAKADYAAMKSMRKPEVMDALEKDRVRAPILETSFPPMWAGPVTSPSGRIKPRAEDEFDDN